MRPLCLALLTVTVAAASTHSRAARADGPSGYGDDEMVVRLKSGDVFRGVLVEKIQDDHLTIRLATGKVMVFPWAYLSPADASSAFVHLDASDARATLSREVGSGYVMPDHSPFAARRLQYGSLWETVCVMPCLQGVSTSAVYRVEGDGILPSSSFRLDPGPVHLYAKTGSRGGLLGGVLLTMLGGGSTLMGGALLGLSTLSLQSTPSQAESAQNAKHTLFTMGLVMLGTGAVELATGIVLWSRSRTTVTDEGGKVVGGTRPPPRRGLSLTPNGLVF